MKISEFTVEKISRDIGREFVMEHHYSGSCQAVGNFYGLFHGEELVGVCVFAMPIGENTRRYIWEDEIADKMKDHVTELHRLVTLDSCPHNTESWFISNSLDELKKDKPKYKAVVTFADPTEGHKGTIYKASNAIYYGQSRENTQYVDDDGKLRANRSSSKFISREEAKEKGWETSERDSKHRYLFLLPDEYETKDDLRDKLDIKEMPYP